jgi:hypothetical protein
MAKLIPVITVYGLVLLSGVVEGIWTGRWARDEHIEAAAAKLSYVPIVVGDWDGQELELDAREITAAGASGYLRRTYVNRRTGNTVSLLIICGRPGPVSVHTPDICYQGIGYDQVGAPVKHSVTSEPAATFWVRKFRKNESVVLAHLRILYSWSATGIWTAADNPRFSFARYPVLYKMYVIRELPRGDEPLEGDPCLEFLDVLLPELQKALYPPV